MLYGAIIGDIVGSRYEFRKHRSKKFSFFDRKMFFTDDTVMTLAVYEALAKEEKNNYANLHEEVIYQMKKYGHLYPYAGYGVAFGEWLFSRRSSPYNSFGNGSAMRVSPVAYFAKSESEVKKLSRMVSEVTHNHPEGIKGAEAVSMCIWLARHGIDKEEIKKYVEKNYYSLNFNYEDLRSNYFFNETCMDTVPQAIYCFLTGNDFEDCIRTGISIGGDSDTLCAITGSIAEAYYGVDEHYKISAERYLDNKLLLVLRDAEKREQNKSILKKVYR